MRLWSLHPKYLDSKGLVAAWREALLAQAVLAGKTKGYTKHPQLIRFKEQTDPLKAIGLFLSALAEEARARAYAFNESKILSSGETSLIPVTKGQLEYECKLLKAKLLKRDTDWLKQWRSVKTPLAHPLFKTAEGGIEEWEKV